MWITCYLVLYLQLLTGMVKMSSYISPSKQRRNTSRMLKHLIKIINTKTTLSLANTKLSLLNSKPNLAKSNVYGYQLPRSLWCLPSTPVWIWYQACTCYCCQYCPRWLNYKISEEAPWWCLWLAGRHPKRTLMEHHYLMYIVLITHEHNLFYFRDFK